MWVVLWRELLNWGDRLLHRLLVRALGYVNDHAAASSEGLRPTAKHLEAVWWLFVALSWANEGSPEIYVSKVVFLFTQRPAGPSVSTAPVHPPDCFMIDPNRLINHSAGHYGYSSAQILHKMTGKHSVFQSLLNRIIEQLLALFWHAFLFLWLLQFKLEACRVLARSFFALLSLNLIILFLTIVLWSTHFLPCTVYQSSSLPRPHSGTDYEDWRLCHICCNHAALIQLALDSEGTELWIDRELRKEEKEQWIPLPLSNTIISHVISISIIPTPAVKCAIYFPPVICRQI